MIEVRELTFRYPPGSDAAVSGMCPAHLDGVPARGYPWSLGGPARALLLIAAAVRTFRRTISRLDQRRVSDARP